MQTAHAWLEDRRWLLVGLFAPFLLSPLMAVVVIVLRLLPGLTFAGSSPETAVVRTLLAASPMLVVWAAVPRLRFLGIAALATAASALVPTSLDRLQYVLLGIGMAGFAYALARVCEWLGRGVLLRCWRAAAVINLLGGLFGIRGWLVTSLAAFILWVVTFVPLARATRPVRRSPAPPRGQRPVSEVSRS